MVILMKTSVSVEDVGVAIAAIILPKISALLLQVVCVGRALCPLKKLD